MPLIDETLNDNNLARLLVYGAAKTRKTWFATSAAELGFNVILADIDYGFHVTQNLSMEARKRIYHLDMRAPVEDFKNSGALSLIYAAQGGVTFYNEDTRRYTPKRAIDPEGHYAVLDFTKLTNRDVLIIDSWTELVTHATASDQMIVDPTAVRKLEWDDYGKIRLLLDLFLDNLAKLNCHVIIIGHSETYAKRKKDAPKNAKPEDAYEQFRVQPMSISRPHAETMASKFTDVLFFYIQSSMMGTQVSTKGCEDFDAGSRRLAPSVYKFPGISFSDFIPADMLDAVKNNEKYSSLGVYPRLGADLLAELGAKPAPTINADKATKANPLNLGKRT